MQDENTQQIQQQRAALMIAILSIDVSKKTIPNMLYNWIQLNKTMSVSFEQIKNTAKNMFNFKIFGGRRSIGKTSKRKHRKSRRHL
jgi:hypothetical protein